MRADEEEIERGVEAIALINFSNLNLHPYKYNDGGDDDDEI